MRHLIFLDPCRPKARGPFTTGQKLPALPLIMTTAFLLSMPF